MPRCQETKKPPEDFDFGLLARHCSDPHIFIHPQSTHYKEWMQRCIKQGSLGGLWALDRSYKTYKHIKHKIANRKHMVCVCKIINQRDLRSSLHAHLFRDKSCIQNQKCLCVLSLYIQEACIGKLWEQFLFVVDPTLIRFDPWFVSSMKYGFHSYSSRYPGNITERKKCQQCRLLDTISNILILILYQIHIDF